MAFVDDIKKQLRVTGTAFDTEIQALIDSATIDLQESGVLTVDTTDDFIAQAIALYCKGMFGYDNPEAARFMERYEYDKAKLSTLSKYNQAKLTFTVKDSSTVAIEGATIGITIGDVYMTSLTTNSKGVAYYYTDKYEVDVDYTVSKIGYTAVTSTIYVDGAEAIAVTLT